MNIAPDPTTDRIADRLDAAPAHLAALRARLAADATAAGLVDATYEVVDTPIGPLLIVATDRGVVRVAFEGEDHDAVLADLAATIGPRILQAPEPSVAATQVAEYFAGRRRAFELPLDLRLVTGFRHDVVAHLAAIPYGTTASYATVAADVGNPGAVRAVGTACARNPVPILLPCHRVVRADGTPGRYRGGDAAKRLLLALESAA